jgi:hypothetical protein
MTSFGHSTNRRVVTLVWFSAVGGIVEVDKSSISSHVIQLFPPINVGFFA